MKLFASLTLKNCWCNLWSFINQDTGQTNNIPLWTIKFGQIWAIWCYLLLLLLFFFVSDEWCYSVPKVTSKWCNETAIYINSEQKLSHIVTMKNMSNSKNKWKVKKMDQSIIFLWYEMQVKLFSSWIHFHLLRIIIV